MKYIFFLLIVILSDNLISQEENQHFRFGNEAIPIVDNFDFEGVDINWRLAIYGIEQDIDYRRIFDANQVFVQMGPSDSNVKYRNDEGDVFYTLELKY